MTKTKVLFLSRLYVPHIGGVETHVAKVAEFLQTKNFQVTVVTERHEKKLPKREVLENILVKRITLPRGRTNKFFIWWWVIRHALLFLNADVIHVHDVFFWILPIYPLLKLFAKKIYITFHGYEAPGPLTKRQIWWHHLAARWTRGNICVGNFHKKYYGIKPNIVTYGGVENG